MAAAKGNNYCLKRKVNPQHTPEQIAIICEELLDYAENDKSIFFVGFCRKKGFYKSWLLRLCDHHPELKAAYDEAKELMSQKIGNLCFYDKESGVNANFGKDNLFRYDKEWVAHMKWKADIQKEQPREPQTQGIFNQIIDEIKKGSKSESEIEPT